MPYIADVQLIFCAHFIVQINKIRLAERELVNFIQIQWVSKSFVFSFAQIFYPFEFMQNSERDRNRVFVVKSAVLHNSCIWF